MKRTATMTYTVAGLAVAGLVVFAAAPVVTAVTAVTAVTTAHHPLATAESATRAAPDPTPTPDPDAVIWLGDGISVKVSSLPNGCTTYSKIQIFAVNARSYGRLIGEPEDRGPSQGATGTVNRDTAGNIISYTAAPGDDTWSIGDRLCTNPLMIGRYNHVGSDHGEHALLAGETMVIHPDMNVEWVPAG